VSAQKKTAVPAGTRNGGDGTTRRNLDGRLYPVADSLTTPGQELRALASQVRRLSDPFRADPERIFAEKDEIAARLLQLARRLEVAA
jgi:hypothetical protein